MQTSFCFCKELDWESIAAGLLHDTVEDTDVVTFDRIEKEFGTIVRNIVEGETKVVYLFSILVFYFIFHLVMVAKLRISVLCNFRY
jgi:HD domain